LFSRFVRTGPQETTPSGSRLEQLIAADSANQRIIDQLNSQVDFLNDQLALREAQLADAVEKLTSIFNNYILSFI
jgi:hypothetical protein